MFILPVSDDIGMVYSWVYHIHTVNIVNVRGYIYIYIYIYIYSHKNVKKVAHPHGTSNPFYGDLGDVLFPYMYTIVIYVIICIYSHGHPVCRNQPKQSSKQEGILGSPVRSPELLTALVKL